MWFDVRAALAEIEGAPCATCATTATQDPLPLPRVAHVAHVAHPAALISDNPPCAGPESDMRILNAIRAGNRRPGPVATETRLGATVTYRLLDRLIAEGHVTQARDGTLNVIEADQ